MAQLSGWMALRQCRIITSYDKPTTTSAEQCVEAISATGEENVIKYMLHFYYITTKMYLWKYDDIIMVQ